MSSSCRFIDAGSKGPELERDQADREFTATYTKWIIPRLMGIAEKSNYTQPIPTGLPDCNNMKRAVIATSTVPWLLKYLFIVLS